MRALARFPQALLLTLLAFLLVVGPAAAAEPADFTVVLIPDTQYYSETFHDNYGVQTKWIRDVTAQRNVKFAIHLGDIVQNPEEEDEWQVADRAHRLLDGHVPYSVLPGNHDGAPGATSLYNKYFGPQRFAAAAWYGGNENGKNDNNYCRFTAAGMPFLVLSLEYNPTEETLQWAARVVASHARDRVILATHCYSTPEGRNATGDRVWERLVRKNDNIFLVLSGHVLGIAHHARVNDSGHKVHEILCDYQGFPHGGDGWLQTLRFAPAENAIYVEAYSPLLDESKEEPPHKYTIEYDMTTRPAAEVGASQ